MCACVGVWRGVCVCVQNFKYDAVKATSLKVLFAAGVVYFEEDHNKEDA